MNDMWPSFNGPGVQFTSIVAGGEIWQSRVLSLGLFPMKLSRCSVSSPPLVMKLFLMPTKPLSMPMRLSVGMDEASPPCRPSSLPMLVKLSPGDDKAPSRCR
jgi:hypothetical protein